MSKVNRIVLHFLTLKLFSVFAASAVSDVTVGRRSATTSKTKVAC